MAFHSPTGRFHTDIVLPFQENATEIFELVLREFVERSQIDVAEWAAGDRRDEEELRPGVPSAADLATLRNKTMTAASLNGRYDDAAILGTIQILVHKGEGGRNTYGITDCVGLMLTSCDLEADTTPARTRRVLDSHYALVRALLARYPAMRAHILRSTNSYAPTPPHARSGHLLYIAHRDDIAESYDNPEVYWQAWDKVEPLDANRVLVTRALDIEDELDFKKSVYPRTWELARQARPKLTQYFAAEFRDFDIPYVDGPDAVATAAGYHPQEQWIEYTAYAPGDTHILPREILSFDKWLAEGKMPDDQPLKEVRVTFVNREMAMKERRPLLDIGCRVFYYEKDGALLELKDV